jgi:hypothetical protein
MSTYRFLALTLSLGLALGCSNGTSPDGDSSRTDNAGTSSIDQRSEADSSAAASSSDVASESASSVAAAEQAQKESPDKPDSGNELQLPNVTFTIPEGWQRKAASSSFVLAEITLPRAGNDEADGRLTVSAAGGSVDANLERWRGQFGGKPESSTQDKKQIDGMDVVIVDYAGTFNDQAGPFAPGVKRPGYRMLGAILPVGDQLHFVKATGPQATIAAHADRIHAFIASAKKR